MSDALEGGRHRSLLQDAGLRGKEIKALKGLQGLKVGCCTLPSGNASPSTQWGCSIRSPSPKAI